MAKKVFFLITVKFWVCPFFCSSLYYITIDSFFHELLQCGISKGCLVKMKYGKCHIWMPFSPPHDLWLHVISKPLKGWKFEYLSFLKNGDFQFSKSFFWPKIKLIILKMIFVLQYETRRTNFSNNFFNFIHVHEILFSKNVPYFC